MSERIRVGSRGSALARAQTDIVLRGLRRASPSRRFEPVYVHTSGDRDQRVGSSPDFTDEIDRMLLSGEIELAVHSAKDLPVELDPAMSLWSTPARADPRDCLVVGARPGGILLPRRARIGSSSPRRRAQLLHWRPDLRIVEIRGNVDTRIGWVRSGRLDAVILAVAGLRRLGWTGEIARILDREEFVPAPAQGALAIVGRTSDRASARLARRLNHDATLSAVRAERAFAAALGADCRVPVGCVTTVRGGSLSVVGDVLAPDGRRRLRARRNGPAAQPERVGSELGRTMLEGGAAELMGGRR